MIVLLKYIQDGPLYCDYFDKKELTRNHNEKVALKCLKYYT